MPVTILRIESTTGDPAARMFLFVGAPVPLSFSDGNDNREVGLLAWFDFDLN